LDATLKGVKSALSGSPSRVLYNGITSPFQGEVRGSTPLTRSDVKQKRSPVRWPFFFYISIGRRSRTPEHNFLAGKLCDAANRPHLSDGEYDSHRRLTFALKLIASLFLIRKIFVWLFV
jgi:hypothetical protein